ncbi:hypothetical protein E4U22_000815 [Claviceps purpurea]|nr:hypothetical protein E4U51_006916 [Claviceps purpurea]KAG6193398.1 hypothetical protein E4U27_007721 [Claviceps purpurea]KAG6200505.1 hypothetical protein E4U35_006194 [Claviceps purpurea]KAG6201004.1 hypothetical protein E4U10_000917 [Claviceps purpurea]KAG6324603.1 hypothetical protein E4U22_000815 [Claviceps purpurea]
MPSIRIDNQELYYTWSPRANGPILLFVHGVGSSHSFYSPIIPSLVKKGHSCLAFDIPGSALSTYRGRGSDVEAICGAALALIAVLKLDSRRVIVVGHAMGTIVASEMALYLNPLGIILIGPMNPSPQLADVFAARGQLVQKEGMEGVVDVFLSVETGPRATATQKAFIRSLLLAQSPAGYSSLCSTIMNAQTPRYEEATCPLLIIAGSDDNTSPMAGSQAILDSWGVAAELKRMQVLRGVGHWHCIEAADEVEALVDEFAQGMKSILSTTRME